MKQSIPTQELPFQQGLKKFIARKGLSQKALADKIYVASCTISAWTLGRSDPSVTVSLLALEGMTLEEIFGKELADKLIENSKLKEAPKEAPVETKEENRSDVQKRGFISKLAMLFSSRGNDE